MCIFKIQLLKGRFTNHFLKVLNIRIVQISCELELCDILFVFTYHGAQRSCLSDIFRNPIANQVRIKLRDGLKVTPSRSHYISGI